MNTQSKIIPLHLHPLGFIESFTDHGVTLCELLKKTHINENMIGRSGIQISYAQLHTLIKNGIRLCNKKGMGLIIGQNMDWSFHGNMGSIVYCSPTLKDAYSVYFRYLRIAQPLHMFFRHEKSFYVDPNETIVHPLNYVNSLTNDQEIIEFEMEFQLATILRLCDLCGNKSVKKNEVNVKISRPEPTHKNLYHNLPCSHIEFNADTSVISAHIDFTIYPWRKYRQAAFYRTIQSCENDLKLSEISDTTSSKIRWIISSMYFHCHITLESVCHMLKTTPRSLTRKLARENTSFRCLYHEVRMEITFQHLKYSKLTIDEITQLMRFSNISSLRRAVKNWSGVTVGEFKNQKKKPIKNLAQTNTH